MNNIIHWRFAAIFIFFFVTTYASAHHKSPYFDNNGQINLPQNFRDNMVHIGAWFVPKGAASGFHEVFTNKDSVTFYKKNGYFPDGAILVKELRSSKAGNYTTGSGVHHSTSQVKQWFVMIKDRKNRFKNNPLWGDGWGWALFKPDNPTKNVATNYKVDCLGCHLPAKKNDLVYMEAYPSLK